MEGGVAFLHTRAKDKGKIGRPFIVVGRSWEGISFSAPDGNPTYLFFLLGLKYDRLHLPILGRLARALRNPATIAKLRALSSPDQVRALLLKEDAAVRAGQLPYVPQAAPFKPKLDRQLRLRAIRRLQTLKKAEHPSPSIRIAPDDEPPAKSGRASGTRASGTRAGGTRASGTRPSATRAPAAPPPPPPRAASPAKKKKP
jgi:hypothetical protein